MSSTRSSCGGWHGRSADKSSSASKITTVNDADLSSRAHSSRIWSGSGLRPTSFPPREFRAGATPGRQSDRDAAYREAVAPLMTRGLVYACDCSRQQIDRAVYSGRCRDRDLPLADDVGWRVRVEPHDERFEDALVGTQQQSPARQCGDFLIRDRLGNWTYQWAATTDDTLQRIALVIRGEDLLDSTGRQIMLARLLGRAEPPVFAHHPLRHEIVDTEVEQV